MNLAFEPFAQSINLNSIHPSILFFFFFYCKLFQCFYQVFYKSPKPQRSLQQFQVMFMCFFSFVLLDFFIFPLWVYGRKSETLSMKEKKIFFYYYYLAILPYLVSFWIFEYIHMQFYCKPWCTENKLKGSVSQGALKSKEFARHMNFLIHANLSTSPK